MRCGTSCISIDHHSSVTASGSPGWCTAISVVTTARRATAPASSCPDKVADRVKDALPISLLLMFYAQLLALVIAIPMGVLTAYRAGSVFDKTVNTTAFALLAIPNFVLALVLAYYVGTKLGWVDPTGYIDFGQDPVGHFQQLALPVISLAVGQIAVYMRLLRSDMIATLQEDFVTMARPRA